MSTRPKRVKVQQKHRCKLHAPTQSDRLHSSKLHSSAVTSRDAPDPTARSFPPSFSKAGAAGYSTLSVFFFFTFHIVRGKSPPLLRPDSGREASSQLPSVSLPRAAASSRWTRRLAAVPLLSSQWKVRRRRARAETWLRAAGGEGDGNEEGYADPRPGADRAPRLVKP